MDQYKRISFITTFITILFCKPLFSGDLSIVLGEVDKDAFPRICFNISVKDSLGDKITDLDTSMVKVFEDSVQNKNISIQTLAETETQVAILIAVDASGSMAGAAIDSVRSAISSFTDRVSDNDKIGVLTFNDDVKLICPFTSNMDTVKILVDSIKANGYTELHYGVSRGLQLLNETKDLPKNKMLIVLADGKDTGTAYTDDDVIEKAQEYGIPIFSIGYHTKEEKKYLRVLERMADKTGGDYNDAPSIKDIDDVYDSVYEQIQARQTICLNAEIFQADSMEHSLHVFVSTEDENGDANIVFQAPASIKEDSNWFVMAGILALLIGISYYMNKKNRERSDNEKQKLLDEKDALKRELEDAKRPQSIDDDHGQKDMTEVVDQEPDSRHTVISGRPMVTPPDIKLHFENGPLEGQDFLVSNGMTLGRSEGNSLTIADQTISGEHAKIVNKGGSFAIVDLNSTNGVQVNGQMVSEISIGSGDRMQFGKVKVIVIMDNS